jgi:hypothetical protein
VFVLQSELEPELSGESNMYTSVQMIDERFAVFKCRRCKKVVRIETSDFICRPAHQFDLTCACGHLNKSVLEYRRSIRKSTNIPGIYKVLDDTGTEKTGSMTVRDISWQGFKLKTSCHEHGIKAHDVDGCRYKCEGHHSRSIFIQNFLKKKERITIEFFLDDPKMSFISRDVFVHWIRNDMFGVELCYPENYEPSIRFYLLGLKTP